LRVEREYQRRQEQLQLEKIQQQQAPKIQEWGQQRRGRGIGR